MASKLPSQIRSELWEHINKVQEVLIESCKKNKVFMESIMLPLHDYAEITDKMILTYMGRFAKDFSIIDEKLNLNDKERKELQELWQEITYKSGHVMGLQEAMDYIE